ncbi:MAG: hypothetical protein A2V70_09340 [Planctomycetes bacterium RBG_13_63_9]|nr:MAG: hypothetical protein A2V70_09340 [Planctomycetes bacterium RBG_13_63_9]
MALLVTATAFWLTTGADQPAAAQQMRGTRHSQPIPAGQYGESYRIAQDSRSRVAEPRETESVLKAYPCPAADAAALGEELHAQFGQLPNVRIVVDGRTSQILVQAPATVQTQIANRLSGPPQATPPQNGLQQNAPQQNGLQQNGPSHQNLPQPVRSRELRLQNSTARQIEATLVRMMGNRLSSVPNAAFGMRNYELAVAGGGTINLGIHHQTNHVIVQGVGPSVDSCVRLIQALDSPPPTNDSSTQMVPLRAASPASVQRAIHAIRAGTTGRAVPGRMVATTIQQPDQLPPVATPDAQPAAPPEGAGAAAPPNDQPPNGQPPEGPEEGGGLIGPVQIELLEGLDVIVVHGHRRDVEQVLQIIDEIDRISAETVPAVEIYQLKYVNCEALASLISPLYEQVYLPRQGSVSITALVKPNALLLVGRSEAVQTVLDLVKQLDQPVSPESQFQVFRLRHAAAATAEQTIRDFFGEEEDQQERPGLAPRVLVASDFRSNSLIVRASPRDMADVATLIARLDTPTSEAVNEIRVFQLENSLAEDVAEILNGAIGVDETGRRAGGGPAGPGAAAPSAAGRQEGEQKSTMLRFATIDTQGQRRLTSGILTDVRITADVRANALVVSAPTESMTLIEALIQRVDKLPAAEAQIKVFTIVNGDATNLIEMLETLFAEEAGADQLAVRTGASEGESSLVQLKFAVDQRTNSIIVSGSMGDLRVVEAILLRLDSTDAFNRKTDVYRLKNAPAEDVANAINQFLESKREVEQIREDVLSPFEQIEREVIVVPELVSNSLIVSATERFYDEIKALVAKLDEKPPMVMIQVLIAEVTLNDTDEFGVELGLQDSVLFDRSLLGDLVEISQTTQTAASTVSNQTIVGASNTPGFAFNNQTLGNSGSDKAFADSHVVGSQSLSHFAVGRTNSELGFGGLVLSASSESVSILIRALKECRRLDVLSRPQIMTLDNQPAWIQVGQHVPMIRGTSVNEAGQTNRVEFEDVGLIMAVQPRISPDNQVVMLIDATKSAVGPEEEGIPISISATGEVIRSPRIDTTNVKTTVSAADGQTMILGGLITKSKAQVHRKVPVLGDIPIIRDLFRYDLNSFKKTELLIIMTPHIVRSEADSEMIRQVEAARMSWCLCDVLELCDDPTLRSRSGEWSDAETNVVYPDLNPGGRLIPVPDGVPNGQETIPTPEANPFRPDMLPAPDDTPAQPSSAPPTPMAPPTPTLPPTPTFEGSLPEGSLPEGSLPQGFLPQGALPSGAVMNLRRVEQAYYQPGYPGQVDPAVYQQHGTPPPYGRTNTGQVVPLNYQAPPQQFRQPSTARLPQPYTPSYR